MDKLPYQTNHIFEDLSEEDDKLNEEVDIEDGDAEDFNGQF